MMQTTTSSAEHSKGSFVRDLLGRESNVVLLDESEKVSYSLYNVFYQLFDEGLFIDTNYEVDIRDGIFILTSNFATGAEIKQSFGAAIYSHIGSCIVFDDLSLEAKQTMAERHVSEVYQCLDDEEKESIDSTDLAAWFQDDAERYDSMRIMKTKIDRVVFGHLTDRLLSDLETEDEPA